MSINTWVISDTHFNDFELLTYYTKDGIKVRNFSSVEEMNELMIENWNSVVKPTDKIYHLGDVARLRNKDDKLNFEGIWFRLNGHKRLIIGNHDDIRYLSGKSGKGNWFFEEILFWKKYPGLNLLLSHVPLEQSSLYSSSNFENQLLNIHGHTHMNGSPDGPYKSVCVELINYTPVHIEDLY